MPYLIKEPIYSSDIRLTKEEAFEVAKKFSCNRSIIYENKNSGIIELNYSYVFSFIFYYTWIKKIIIRIEKSSTNTSKVSVFGIPAILPHNFLLSSVFLKRKIDLGNFTETLQSFFKEYEIKPQMSCSSGSTLWIDVVFFFLEFLAFIFTSALFYYTRMLKAKENVIVLTFLVLLFILPQISLIIWFSRDCYSRTFSSYKSKKRWAMFIGLTGFIGCFFYYFFVNRPEKRGQA